MEDEVKVPEMPVTPPDQQVDVQVEPIETVEPIVSNDPAFGEELDGQTSKDATPMEIDVAGVDSTDDVKIANE